MFIKSLFLGALAACLMLVPSATFGSGTSTPASTATVTITATVDPFAEWTSVAPSIVAATWDNGHVAATNTNYTAHVDMTLNANTSTTIKATVGSDGTNGILTLGSQTLTTTYEVTGAVDTPDSSYRAASAASAGDMFNVGTQWTTTHTSSSDPYAFVITLNVIASTPSPLAVEPGDYSTQIVLTASW